MFNWMVIVIIIILLQDEHLEDIDISNGQIHERPIWGIH